MVCITNQPPDPLFSGMPDDIDARRIVKDWTFKNADGDILTCDEVFKSHSEASGSGAEKRQAM